MIIGGSGSGKINALLNLIREQGDIDKICLYAKDLSEPKYEFLSKKRKEAGTKHFNDPNALIECSNTMDDVYENIHEYNRNRKIKILIMFDDMIADIMTNKKFQAIIKELFIRHGKLNIWLVLSLNLTLLSQKISVWIEHIIWFWKSTTEKNYKILWLIILQILIIKI